MPFKCNVSIHVPKMLFFKKKLVQRPVDDMQKYVDDTRTTCRRHITRGFCPKMKKKHPGAPKWQKQNNSGALR